MMWFKKGAAIAALALLAGKALGGSTTKVPNMLNNGSTGVEYVSELGRFDNQKVTPYPTSNEYEWWYFDVAGTSANESVVVVFYIAPNTAFPAGPYPQLPLGASVTVTRANGSTLAPLLWLSANSSVTLETEIFGESGYWGDAGISFRGSPLLNTYTINVDNPDQEIKGIITFDSVAPAHFPCGLNGAGQTELVMPHVGWANAIPDSNSKVDLTIAGKRICFSGVGYHDKNWGDIPFPEAVKSWYWGHARLGPYSFVWYDALDVQGNETVSGYVALDGVPLDASCRNGTVKVRPYGADAVYPPVAGKPIPDGITIEYDLGVLGKIELKAPYLTAGAATSVYDRFYGKVSGGFVGQGSFEGSGIFEQFAF